MNKICIIGVGPGTKDYLLPVALKRIRESGCLIAAQRVLKEFKNLKKERILMEGHFNEIIPYVKRNRNKKKIAILVSGDPGLYSFLHKISAVLKKKEYEVIPGISAMQLAFAKIGQSWQEAKIISLHGREMRNLAVQVRNNPVVFLFTDAEAPPEKIAAYLIVKGITRRRVIVLERLGYPDERIIDTNLRKLSKMRGFGLCVMIIKKENSTE